MDLYELKSLLASQTLDTSHRTLRLAWPEHLQSELETVLLPQRAVITEGICEPIAAHITCLSAGRRLPLHELLGRPLALQMLTDRGELRSFPVVVTQASLGRSDGGLTVVSLVGRDPMSLMDERRRLRCFRGTSVVHVVDEVLGDWKSSSLGACFTHTWLGVNVERHPVRACFIQHPDESDSGFVQRLLRGAGIAWFWRTCEANEVARRTHGLPRQELVLFEGSQWLPQAVSERLRYHRRDATERADTIDLLMPQWHLVPEGARLRSWDHESAQLQQGQDGFGQGEDRFGLALAQALASTRVGPPHMANDQMALSLMAAAELKHQRFRVHTLLGRSGVRTLAPGTYQVIDDFPGFENLSERERTCTTVRVEHIAFNNLPAELDGPAQALMGDEELPEWTRSNPAQALGGGRGAKLPHRYFNRFTAVPRDAPIAPPPLLEHEQPRLRALTGIVLAPKGSRLHSDELGRSWVQLLGGEPGADTTAWVRHRTPWAGEHVGFSAVLRPGTEVDIEWLGYDRPVIAGCHFNGHTQPPRVAHQPGLPHNFGQTALVGREVGGTRQQHLLLDDHPGQPMAQLASEAGHSALSLGQLTTPRRDGRAEPRGNGVELRSDESCAIRMAKALLLSTHGRPQARGHQLDAEELQAQLDAGLAQAAALGDLAQDHQAEDTDTGPQRLLRAHVAAWRHGSGSASGLPGDVQPVLALAGAAGIAAATPASATLRAGENIDVVAARHAQISTGQRFVVRAAEAVSLFAHRLGMKLVAALGTLKLLALKGQVEIGAGKGMHLYASGGQLIAEAAEGLVLRTRGVELVLKDGRMTVNGQAFNVNAASFDFNAPVAVSAPENPLAAMEAPYDQRVLLADMITDLPAVKRRYRITVEDGQVIEGVTDEQGYTQPLRTALSFARFTVELLD